MPDNGDSLYDEVAEGPNSNYPGGWRTSGSFQSALEEAWREARDKGSPNALRIVSISIRGTNPVREYKIDFD
ncbi:MAG: hypothetical protein ACXWYS_05570 [Gaiellaceae bacterium]